MTRTLMPVFLRFPKEAEIIGRLLASYGELEYEFANCLAVAIQDHSTAVRTLFRIRGEKARLDIGDSLMRLRYEAADLAPQYADAIGAIGLCKKIRNQFAHCHWTDDGGVLAFVDLNAAAKSVAAKFEAEPMSVSLTLLKLQEEYFVYARDCLVHLYSEYRLARGEIMSHTHLAPKKMQTPPLHNLL